MIKTSTPIALAACLLAACYNPSLVDGTQQCSSDGQCPDGQRCFPDHRCYATGAMPTCTGCGGATPVCDKTTLKCVGCLADGDCGAGSVCRNQVCSAGCSATHPGCAADAGSCDVDLGICRGCSGDSECAGTGAPRCDKATGLCVACLVSDDNCPDDKYCVGADGRYSCVPGCATSARCAKLAQHSDGGVGAVTCCNHKCVDLTVDATNCGACAAACGNGQACCSAKCSTPASDINNCGGCGQRCEPAHVVARVCSMSACGYDRCVDGFGDCDKTLANGCETGLTDVNNCGGCGTVCTPPLHAQVDCVAMACVITTCDKGFADCDGNYANGCEVDLTADARNCGACKMVCPTPPNGIAACAASRCGLKSCVAPFLDCDGAVVNGCEINPTADKANCGGCNNVCKAANGTPGCAASKCTVVSCNAGFGDCDNSAANGCETATSTDPKNCGACGAACPVLTPQCVKGVCQGLRTVPGFAGQLGPDYSGSGWVQCVGVLDKINVDDLPNMGWGTLCMDGQYGKLRLACGASANSVQYIDVSRNVLLTKLNAFPEQGLIFNASFKLASNDIYANSNDANNNVSWWVNGNGCDEATQSITINNICTWDVANCFGQNLVGIDRYFYVYVSK